MEAWGRSLRTWIGLVLEFAFRRRSPGSTLVQAGLALMVVSLGGWRIGAAYQGEGAQWAFRFATGEGTPGILTCLGFALGASVFSAGAILVYRDASAALAERRRDADQRQRRRVVVIEQRGLLARIDSPLEDALPSSLVGRREVMTLDHTAAMQGGIADRGRLFEDAKQLRRDVRRSLGDTVPADVTVVYGGVAPVPMTFLAGAVLDDEGAVTVMDWDRIAGRWRALDGADDGDRFTVSGLENVPRGTPEVMLAVSASYAVDEEGVQAVSAGSPIVRMSTSNPVQNSHWSAVKQQALAEQFLSVMGRLTSLGVTRVHLFLAAANSLVFNLGRTYDGRNMPEVVVYQYEKSGLWRHPWGIRLPRHGGPEPELVVNDLYPPPAAAPGR